MKSCENCKHRYGSGGEHPYNTCIYTGYGQPPTGWEAGVNYISVTNADRIRAMSNEDLANLLLDVEYCEKCKYDRDGICTAVDRVNDKCREAVLEWLRMPAE